MKTKIKPVSLFVCLLLLPFLIHARIIYVDHAATGANNGTSWVNAFEDLSDALSAATAGDELWIADGVYTPSTSFDFNSDGTFHIREVSFVIPTDVALYGGFNGGEVSRDERDWDTNLTVLSGDIDHNDLNSDSNGIAENRDHIVGSNAYHIVATFNGTSYTKADGLIITGGLASDESGINANGAGWYNLTRSALSPDGPVISNCLFRGNFAFHEGGAIYNSDGSSGLVLHIENCKFIENAAWIAAGIYLPFRGELRMSGSEFISNKAKRLAGALILAGDFSRIESTVFRNNSAGSLPENELIDFRPQAGAIYMGGSNAFFDKCTFENNFVINGPFARIVVEGGGGGAIRMEKGESSNVSSPIFWNCGFYANETRGRTKSDRSFGGAIIHFTRNGILRPRYINCVFAENRSNAHGGAVASFMEHLGPLTYSPALTPEFTNCTFSQNFADEKGGAIYNDEFITGTEVLRTRLENCILWNNSALEGNEVFNLHDNTFVIHSIIRGSGGSGAGWNNTVGDDGGNNLDIDPGFTDPGNPFGPDGAPATNDDGLRLASLTSPAVNTGNNSAAALSGVTLDYPQNPRIIGPTIDMGAYERSGLLMAESLFPWVECFDCPWAFSLLPFDPTFIWDGKGIISRSQDGKSATITGRIVSLKNNKIAFDVYLKLLNQQDWKTWNSKNRTFTTSTPESADIAKKTINSWTFWELSSDSFLKGSSDVSGVLNLKPSSADFKTGVQFGYGANGWDTSSGISSTFYYQGDLLINGKTTKLKGTGTMNVDAEPCLDCSEYTASLISNETATTKTSDTSIDIITFPVPATNHVNILSESVPVETYSLMLYDSEGNLKKSGTWNSEKADYELMLENMKSGLYVIKLTSSQGDVLLKKFLIK